MNCLTYLPRKEYAELETHLQKRPILDKVCVRFPLNAGLRRDELAHMVSHWLDTQHERISIPPGRACDCSTCRAERPIGRWQPRPKQVRRIPVNSELFALAQTWFNANSTLPDIRTIDKRLVELSSELGFSETLTVTLLRNTFAYRLSMRGHTHQEIAKRIGTTDAGCKTLLSRMNAPRPDTSDSTTEPYLDS